MSDAMTPTNTSTRFATATTAVAVVALGVVAFVAWRSGRGEPDAVTTPTAVTASNPPSSSATTPISRPADGAAPTAEEIVARSAAAMAEVGSVEFTLERDGAPVFIDQFGRLALDKMRGQFVVPDEAQAEITVTVDGNLTTRLGAVLLDDEVLLSNPVTGRFEPLPDGYDIDPSKFFDPKGGWQPLLDGLRDVTLVGVGDRGGDRYHVRGTAPADRMTDITGGLVRGQDVLVDLWIHPDSHLVTGAEFDTESDRGTSSWRLDLSRYDEEFTIVPPETTP